MQTVARATDGVDAVIRPPIATTTTRGRRMRRSEIVARRLEAGSSTFSDVVLDGQSATTPGGRSAPVDYRRRRRRSCASPAHPSDDRGRRCSTALGRYQERLALRAHGSSRVLLADPHRRSAPPFEILSSSVGPLHAGADDVSRYEFAVLLGADATHRAPRRAQTGPGRDD